jgi:hypothetical protein
MRCIVRQCMQMCWALCKVLLKHDVARMDWCLGTPIARMEIACATQESSPTYKVAPDSCMLCATPREQTTSSAVTQLSLVFCLSSMPIRKLHVVVTAMEGLARQLEDSTGQTRTRGLCFAQCHSVHSEQSPLCYKRMRRRSTTQLRHHALARDLRASRTEKKTHTAAASLCHHL